MNILITGGKGIVGSYLTKHLANSHNIFILSRSAGVDLQFDLLNISDQEITDILINNDINLIIHCAVNTATKTREDFYLNSFALNKFFVNKVGREKRYIVIGSAAEYGIVNDSVIDEKTLPNPVSMYGSSKLLQTTLCHYYRFNNNIDVQVLRLFNIITPTLPKHSFVGRVLEETKKGFSGCVRVSNSKIERDFLDIRDFCSLITQIIDYPIKDFLYNVASGNNVTYGFFLDKVIAVLKEHDLPTPKLSVNGAKEKFSNANSDITKLSSDYAWHPNHSLEDSILWCLKEINLI